MNKKNAATDGLLLIPEQPALPKEPATPNPKPARDDTPIDYPAAMREALEILGRKK